MLGLSLANFTLLHVVISLIGILSGFIVVLAMLSNKSSEGWIKTFLATTVLTSVTGYLFPFEKLLPSHIVGGLSLVILAAAIAARYSFNLTGAWRKVYVIGSVAALYFNCFVFVVQLFLKVPALHDLAPNGSEPPFAVAQGLVLVLFIALGYKAVKGFRGEPELKAKAQGV